MARAPDGAAVRVVLAVVLQNVRSGWCDLSRAEIGTLAGISAATVRDALRLLVPDHLERVSIPGRSSMLKPATRVARPPTPGGKHQRGSRVARPPTHIGGIESALRLSENGRAIDAREDELAKRRVVRTGAALLSRKNQQPEPAAAPYRRP